MKKERKGEKLNGEKRKKKCVGFRYWEVRLYREATASSF